MQDFVAVIPWLDIPVFNMLISPTKCMIRQTDLADGLVTISEKDRCINTSFQNLCVLFNSLIITRTTINACISVSK